MADPVTLVTSRAALNPTDSLDWGKLGGNGSNPPYPIVTTTTGGVPVTASRSIPTTTPFEIVVQTPPGTGWSGNFAPGDSLLWEALGGNPEPTASLVLTFGSPIAGAGLQIQPDIRMGAVDVGPFTATIQAFNGGTLLGSFTEAGNSTQAADNSAIFIGVEGSTDDITSLVIGMSAFTGPPNGNDFAVNKLSITTTTSPTPEPSYLLLMAVGVIGLGFFRRRKAPLRAVTKM
jgi:hypothetical protein